MSKIAKSFLKLCLLAVIGLPVLAAGNALALETAPEIIRANALLGSIYDKNPAEGVRLAHEVRTYLASIERAEPSKGRDSAPTLRRRGGLGITPGDPESEMERQNKKVFEENPALKKMYFHSPLAYLRMLKRIRTAAGTSSQAAAQ